MSVKIPDSEKKLIQTNRSKILGNLWSTFNIDLKSNLGVIRVSPRMKLNTSTVEEANLGVPVAIKTFDTKIFAICDTRIFKASFSNGAFAEDASTGAVTTYSKDTSDLLEFNGTLCATASTGTGQLYSKATDGSGTGAWTARGADLGTPVNMMTVLPKYNRLYVTATSVSKIHSFDTSWTEATSGDYFINIDTNAAKYHINTIRATSTKVWIGTMNRLNKVGRGAILEWDGKSSTVTNTYLLDAAGCMALIVDNEIVYALDSNGKFLKYDGNGFREIGRLPYGSFMPYNPDDQDPERFIHPNGLLLTKENTILALIDNRNYMAGTFNENLPSGIWELDLETGSVTHKYSFSYNPMAGSTITDFGQNQISRVGALANVRIPENNARNGIIMAGTEYYTNATVTTAGLFIDDSNDTVQKYGYFVTTWILSDGIKTAWQCFLKYRQFLNSTDKIVAKYRTTESAPTLFNLTWVNTTSFTTTTSLTVGDEVEITQGTGSGLCAHITAITGSGTYTVTVDETFTGVTTGTAEGRSQKWKKMGTISNQITECEELPIGDPAYRVQIKVCMLFTGENEFFELELKQKSGNIV